ncbi:acyl-CoA dehydratase activase [Desulfoscipio sp. XC116]|uniref:acyl-CoA dehydratase activase n=1 Tax=Desulfoscipio sp. XC116 TaxID=3144975 RepID=UPI00325C1CBA
MYSVGIDVGYSSVKVMLTDENNDICFSRYQMHKGRMKDTLKSVLHEMCGSFDTRQIQYGAVTGSGSKFLSANSVIAAVNDVAAAVEGGLAENRAIGSIIDIGGENASFISGLSGSDKSRIEISMNSNCSSGTGSFLEEQMSRLDLKLADYTKLAEKAKSIPRIAGRCSVFAKTDITHHQQEGVPVPDILLGLAYALVRNYKGTVMKKLPVAKPVLFSGGVAHNGGIITALKDVLDLSDEDLVIPQNLGCVGALGAAVMAKQNNLSVNMNELFSVIEQAVEILKNGEDEIKLPALAGYGNGDSLGKYECQDAAVQTDVIDCYLGVDIGSTSTNLVLLDKEKEIIFYKYLRTLGNPVDAVLKGFREIRNEFGDRINIVGVGTTGSGRYLIGRMVGADVILDEITSQAKAAVRINGDVDTIFEIGGQDSKFISLEKGAVVDFQMNKICAAGTGSFIEEQAKKFSIPIEAFGDIALASANPINLGERCTVFIETSIASCLSQGKELDDIVSGLCYSIVRNYLYRVVGQKRIGNKIFFQGGLAYNQGVVNAFRAVTGKEIIVPPFFSVTGAYGAAIMTKEEMSGRRSSFKGFDLTVNDLSAVSMEKKSASDNEASYNETVRKLVFKDYLPETSAKKTVGIPRALFTYGMFSMFNAFFKELGFNVILSDPTSESTIALGQHYALDETCYPIKLITGHVAELMSKEVDYIFFPDLVTVDHPGSASRKNYGCAYMQLAFKVMNQAMELDKKGISLLSPTMAFHMGRDHLMKSFLGIGQQLEKTPEQTAQALQKGMSALLRLEERMNEDSKRVMSQLKPDEKVFVMISKIYGVADPVLNMGIPEKLAEMGYKVIPFYALPEGNISKEHPNMFWPFGQHILEPAQLIRKHPNLYAIFLTHHGCGPDSILSHYFREAMSGKSYLHIEIDEHSSSVGIITRVEAFINSLKNIKAKQASEISTYVSKMVHNEANIKKSLGDIDSKSIVYLPYLYPYSAIFKEILLKKGIKAKSLPASTRASIEIGRKFTITEEYFSLTALLGGIFKELNEIVKQEADNMVFLIPQNEGTETDGQYSRLLRTKLDEEGFANAGVLSPFWEDILFGDEKVFNAISLCLLAGDIVWNAPYKSRGNHLNTIIELIRNERLDIKQLKLVAQEISKELSGASFAKKVLAVGEFNILFDELLNSGIFKELESKGHRVVYSPFSEAMWMMWHDYANQNHVENPEPAEKRLEHLKENIAAISNALSGWGAFAADTDTLVRIADKTLGFYSGAHGRYRQAKQLCGLPNIDGVITAASMYENTGIVLGMLQKGFEDEQTKPALNLTFDGNKNENDKIKVESFMYYL